jgi:hypothetical protein
MRAVRKWGPLGHGDGNPAVRLREHPEWILSDSGSDDVHDTVGSWPNALQRGQEAGREALGGYGLGWLWWDALARASSTRQNNSATKRWRSWDLLRLMVLFDPSRIQAP